MNTKFTCLLSIVAMQVLAALPAVAAERTGSATGYTTGSVGFLEITRRSSR
jgi:hypothetical protein